MSMTTGKVRLSYCHIWEPQAPLNGKPEDAKYGVTILIPKTDTKTLNDIYAAMAMAEQQGVASKWGGVKPPLVKTPIYDGDGVRPSGEPFGEECRGHMVMTASSKNQPFVYDLSMQPIINRADVYSGCYGRVSIDFFAYAQAGNKGIGCSLNGVQKIEDGEPLSGGVTPQEAFGGANAYTGAVPQVPVQQSYGMPQSAPVQQSYGMLQGAAGYQQNAPAYQQMPMQQSMAAGGLMPAAPGAQVPGYTQQGIQSPAQSMAVDPITGQPMLSGGVMGI